MCPRHYLPDEDSGLKAFVEVGEGKAVLNVRGARTRTDYLKAVQTFVNKELSADKKKKGQPAPGEDVGMPVAAVDKVVTSDGPGGAKRRNEPTEDTTLESRVTGTVTRESRDGRNFR